MKKSAWHLHGTEEGLQQIGKLHLAARDSGQTILEIDVCGKRGVGFCESMPGAVHPFERVNTVAIPSQALRLDGRREGAETRRQHLRRLEALDFMLGAAADLRDIPERVGYDRIFSRR